MAALFLAQATGFSLDLPQQMVIVLASIMAGVGVAGIPEAGLIVLPLVLGAAGLPKAVVVAAIPLVMPVDWIIARCRSVVNVLSDMVVAILLDRNSVAQLTTNWLVRPARVIFPAIASWGISRYFHGLPPFLVA